MGEDVLTVAQPNTLNLIISSLFHAAVAMANKMFNCFAGNATSPSPTKFDLK
jgi:hypothetical protein